MANRVIKQIKKQEESIMLIAIDHGNYAIKTPHFSFVSGLIEHTVKPPMADEVLEYEGKY